MKELRVQVKGFTEKDLRRLRKSREGSAISSGVVLSGMAFVALLYVMDAFRADGGGILTGDCSGTIRASPPRGYVGEPQNVTVTINPPFHRVITRVTTNNPRCQTCEAASKGPGQFVLSGRFEGRGGSFRIEFLALDNDGQIRCRGETEELEVLRTKP